MSNGRRSWHRLHGHSGLDFIPSEQVVPCFPCLFCFLWHVRWQFTYCTNVNGLISLKWGTWCFSRCLESFLWVHYAISTLHGGEKNIQVLVFPEGKPISHAFTFWSKTVNDRVEILAEGFTRVVIGELRGRRGGSILACGCTHVNICVQNKFYCWHAAHPMADATGQKLVLELASPMKLVGGAGRVAGRGWWRVMMMNCRERGSFCSD